MGKSKSSFEKMRREKTNREKKQNKINKKKNKEKETQINPDGLTPEEFMQLHLEAEAKEDDES